MAWEPKDSDALVLRQIITRAREQALSAFTRERKQIEREQAAKGAFGGPVLARSGEAAEAVIKGLARQLVPELVAALTDVCSGPPSSEALDWARTEIQSQINNLVTGLGAQIDGLKTGAGVKGAATRLEPAGCEAKRDADLEIARAGLRSRTARPVSSTVAAAGTWAAASGAMYSLFVSGSPSAWGGSPFLLEKYRFLEFTDSDVKKAIGDLGAAAVDRLIRLPCVFAYENICKKDPLFGVIRRVVRRDRDVRVEYEVVPVTPFLTQSQFVELAAELGIAEFEFHRTHWAVKEVDLRRVLGTAGITLPSPDVWRHPINISTHEFDVALSFPGEARPYVKAVADALEVLLGPDRYFYDNNYKSQLARPDLDLLLQDVYRQRSRLVVVFLSEAYENKPWCSGVEFRAIREIIKSRDQQRVMFVRTDDGAVKGTFSLDGALDARNHSSDEIARMIKQRVDVLA
jgi:hypothetical protein